MEAQFGKVVEEAISKKETSVAELTKKLLEVDTSLRQCLSCQLAVQPSFSAFQCVEDPERRFRLLAGLEFLLGECLREVQSILSKARGEERKKRIADGFAEALKHLLHHQDVLERSCWNELVKPSGESNHADKKRYGGAIGRQVSRCEKHIERVQKDWEKIRELKEEREALGRGEHRLSDEERALHEQAYGKAFADVRRRIWLLLQGAESDDTVIQGARSAADTAIRDFRRREKPIGKFSRLDCGSALAPPERHREGRPRQGRRAAHGKRRGARQIEPHTQFVFAEGGAKEGAGVWIADVRPALTGDEMGFATGELVSMITPINISSVEEALKNAEELVERCEEIIHEECGKG